MSQARQTNIINLRAIRVACQECSLNTLCLPLGMDQAELNRLDDIIERKSPVNRGDHLFQIGDDFHAVYAVRSGSLKSYATTENGHEQIIGFHFPGELIGLDAIAEGVHPLATRALETTSVCAIPYDQLDSLSGELPGLRSQLLRLMSREISHDEQNMIILGQKSADERLATFLIGLSNRFALRGFSSTEFNLSMSRGDIGNYLGLALETVSRLFTRFQQDGLIRVERKFIEILEYDQLYALAGGEHSDHS
ncbi:MAG TPA: fumarate/nitrate reduction transcriptional regulator Fnr [Chromatiales bacterium]|nr:fumarate/nitrate reduction transcriptional regulator Fnr [Thiotrichales bacterium]HIP69199.1 fumarate/nitrate reduction transcriptional regulator Fnr [Chromatiales bacterium]